MPYQRPEIVSPVAETAGEWQSIVQRKLLMQIDQLTVEDYIKAFLNNETKVSSRQRQMLVAHYNAPYQLQTMRQLALSAGYKSYVSANLEYGKVGHLVADYVGLDNPGNWTLFLAIGAPSRASDGEFAWILRDPLAKALEHLGWVGPRPVMTLEAQAALTGLNKKVVFADLPETNKQALINARIGQGGFRQRMLGLWGGRCAVTGCNIGDVLIASHAKAWSVSSNEERLDEFNGLLLVATLDRLFDHGLIGFGDDGSVVKSDRLDWKDLAGLGITANVRLRMVHPRHIPYLQHHRSENRLLDSY